jgi:hypothetical protein
MTFMYDATAEMLAAKPTAKIEAAIMTSIRVKPLGLGRRSIATSSLR